MTSRRNYFDKIGVYFQGLGFVLSAVVFLWLFLSLAKSSFFHVTDLLANIVIVMAFFPILFSAGAYAEMRKSKLIGAIVLCDVLAFAFWIFVMATHAFYYLQLTFATLHIFVVFGAVYLAARG
jgi:hypothetical protein